MPLSIFQDHPPPPYLYRSCIDNEVLAQNELVKQQAIYEQELDGSSLRLQLLEKKLKVCLAYHELVSSHVHVCY